MRPQIVNFAAVAARSVDWLWRPWLPAGCLCLLDGDPGLGKSTITLDLAARISRGEPMPGDDAPAAAGDVLLLSAEDDVEQTIQPRLVAAGADLCRIHFLREVADSRGLRPPLLPGDLEAAVPSLPPLALIVVDPLLAFLGAEFDACRDQEVRRCLHTLARLANRHGTTILLVRHLNKTAGRRALYRGTGSNGIIGAARAALVAGREPEPPHRTVLALVKGNLGPTPTSLAYAVEEKDAALAVRWLGPVAWKADDLLGKPAATDPVAECAAFLEEKLRDGPVPAAQLEEWVGQRGWSNSVYRRARHAVGIKALKRGYQGDWWCQLLPGPLEMLQQDD